MAEVTGQVGRGYRRVCMEGHRDMYDSSRTEEDSVRYTVTENNERELHRDRLGGGGELRRTGLSERSSSRVKTDGDKKEIVIGQWESMCEADTWQN
jgi:hypothetical protein